MEAAQSNHWWQKGNFYSLYINAFAGDIPTLIDRLDYFSILGIDCLHILPHYPSPLHDDGYDITDHTGVRPELGTVADFTALCTAAHGRGIQIMVDLVLNHVSSEHPWFIEARQSKNNPKRDFFLWSENGEGFDGAPNVFPDFKSSNWLPNQATGDFYYATFKPSQPDLNWSNPAVLDAMLEVVDALIAQGADGFRLDAIMNLVEKEGTNSVGIPETHARIKDLRTYLDTHYPGVIILGEIIGTTAESKVYFGQGNECNLAYNFELMNEILYAVRLGSRADRLRAVLESVKKIPKNSAWLAFLRNHDSLSLHLLDPARQAKLLHTFDPDGLYAFSKSTETAQRLFSLLGKDEALMREAFTMLYSLPTATVLYYGDEIGMKNTAPIEPGGDMRRVVRAEFDWEEANRQMADSDSLFHFVRKCISKRT